MENTPSAAELTAPFSTNIGSPRSAPRRRRYGAAQAIAALMLLCFVLEGLWLITRTPLSEAELAYAESASPFVSVPAVRAFHWLHAQGLEWGLRLPFLGFGAMLGASLWYVSRRLYGNAGGYIALALYICSPTMILTGVQVQPEIIAAWGMFGVIFTSIAVAHTLYAPREVVLWNWKRIVLLGAAIGLGASAQLATLAAIPIGLALMFYLAPGRRRAALAIMGAAVSIGALLLLSVRGPRFLEPVYSGRRLTVDNSISFFTSIPLVRPAAWRMIGVFFVRNGAGFSLMLFIAVIAVSAWRHARFFGTIAPVLVAVLLIAGGLAMPHAAGVALVWMALPFLFVFIAGIWADLLQSRVTAIALGLAAAAIAMDAYCNLRALAR